MKPMTIYKSMITIALAIAMTPSMNSAFASACDASDTSGTSRVSSVLPTGSYQGKSDQKIKTHFLVKPVKGREGSFLGILIWANGTGRAYVIDPVLVGSTYAMTPLQITSDGAAGIVDENPSLVLNLDGSHDDCLPGFTISDAKSGNRLGFQGSIVFKAGKTSSYSWGEFRSGTYETVEYGSKEKITLSELGGDAGNQQGSAVFTGDQSSLNGSFFVREKAAGIFSLHENVMKSIGAEVKELPSKILVFINGQAVLVSAEDGTLIGRFKK